MTERSVISNEVRREFRDKGVVLLRNVLSEDIVQALRLIVEAEMASNDAKQFAYTGMGERRFKGSQDIWRSNDTCKSLCTESALPIIAGKLMGSKKVNMFFDHLFIKEPKSEFSTTWHNDLPYWPIQGSQIISLWIALDRVTVSSGALVFCLGSHVWNVEVQPRAFAHKAREGTMETELRLLLGDDSRVLNLRSFPMEQGDVLAFDSMILHCAGPNLEQDRLRRGYSIRYAGDDVTYAPRPGVHKMMLEPTLKVGGPLDSDRYPVVIADNDLVALPDQTRQTRRINEEEV